AYQPFKQCGVCPACLFRRQAMVVGGVVESQGTYSFDLFGTAEEANRVPEQKLKFLKAFLMQVVGWDDIDKTGELPEPAKRHLIETGILKSGDSPQAIINLLARNRDEWQGIAAERCRQGFRWARLLAPARTQVGEGVNHACA